MLFMSLTAAPAPTGPQCVISVPMQSRNGRSRAKTAGSAPTMIERVPSRAACAVRATGASAKATPFAANAAPSSRGNATGTVLMSTTVWPART